MSLVGLDEAYIDYVADDTFVSGLSLLADFPNVVTIRTFSKVYGLAGMRVGYGIGHSDVVTLVQRVRPLFNVNTLAQFGAMAALDDAEFVQLSVRQNAAQRQWLSDRLTELGWRVYPSQTNFIFVDTGREAALLADVARAAGFIIRAGAGWGYPGFSADFAWYARAKRRFGRSDKKSCRCGRKIDNKRESIFLCFSTIKKEKVRT